MKLYDYLIAEGCDYDTYDIEVDVVVTVCLDPEGESDYDEFCAALCKKIDVVDYTCCGDPICDWSGYIKRNLAIFRRFADDNWIKNNYEDNELFVEEWIRELHRFMAGMGDDDQYWFYKQELVDKCE